jgi:hypothetical protein
MTPALPQHRHAFGTADTECRYPVLLDGHFIGYVFRWHRAWIATPAGLETEIRVSAGSIGKDAAARYLCDEFDAGRIAPHQKAPKDSSAERDSGPAPLLHPRMDKPHNRAAALTAVRGLSDLQWTPLGGYPGADNPWLLSCDRCGWVGVKYWSHLRGRKGNPPSPFRHPGCTGRG